MTGLANVSDCYMSLVPAYFHIARHYHGGSCSGAGSESEVRTFNKERCERCQGGALITLKDTAGDSKDTTGPNVKEFGTKPITLSNLLLAF